MSTYVVLEHVEREGDYLAGVFDNYNAAVAHALELSKSPNSPYYCVCGYRTKEDDPPGRLSLVYAMEVSHGAIEEEYNYR